MSQKIIFESHSTTEHNELGIASGHLDPPLSAKGKEQAVALGERYKNNPPAVVLCSDLKRSYETATIAFPNIPIIKDSRLREWNYGYFNGLKVEEIESLKWLHIQTPFPNGENLLSAIERIESCLDEHLNNFSQQTVMIIGHRATYYALEHRYNKRSLETILKTPWTWQPGWIYQF